MRTGVGHGTESISVGSLPIQDRLRLSRFNLGIHEVCVCSHAEWHIKHHQEKELLPSTCCRPCKKCELPIRMEAHEAHEKTCTLQVDTSILKTLSPPAKKKNEFLDWSTWRGG